MMNEQSDESASVLPALAPNRPRRALRDAGRRWPGSNARNESTVRARRRNISKQNRLIRVYLPADVAISDPELEAIETFLDGFARSMAETLKHSRSKEAAR